MELKKAVSEKRCVIIALDQGMEHGPSDFNDWSMDPRNIVNALSQHADGFMLNRGIAEIAKPKCSLILKLTGKTALCERLMQAPIASVEDAKKLKASAVAATVYIGSPEEQNMMAFSGRIISEAKRAGLYSMGLMYPRGPLVKNKHAPEIVAYAARAGAELGFDCIKTHYTGSRDSFARVVEACPKPVLMAGGGKTSDAAFLTTVKNVMEAGAAGVVVGRNVWQHKAPLKMLEAVTEIVKHDSSAGIALRCLK